MIDDLRALARILFCFARRYHRDGFEPLHLDIRVRIATQTRRAPPIGSVRCKDCGKLLRWLWRGQR